MKYTMRIFMSLLLAILLAVPAFAAQQAELDATITFTPEGSEPKSFDTNGKVFIEDKKLRFEAENPITKELTVLIIDSEADKLYVIYPDTLNGLEGKLSETRSAERMTLLGQVLRNETTELPEGWTREPAEAKLKDMPKTKHTLTSPDGIQLSYIFNPEKLPVMFEIKSDKSTFLATFGAFSESQKKNLFAPGESYTLVKLKPEQKLPIDWL